MSLRTSEDPWASIGVDASQLLGRRVAGDHALPIYWAVDHAGVPGLIVRGIDCGSAPPRLPKTQGVSTIVTGPDTDKPELKIFLQSPGDRDVFLKLCLDVVSYSSGKSTAKDATLAIFRRLDHWCALLRRKPQQELGPEEIRGLIGELLVLKRLAGAHGIVGALKAWVAPDDHPQDFALGATLLEVKTRLAGSRQHVHISSLEQLETDRLPLYLRVIELAPGSTGASFTLNSLIGDISDMAASVGADAVDLAERLALRRGYLEQPEYDADRYELGSERTFLVGDGFPRLVRSTTDRGIHRAAYVLDLTALAPFECDGDVQQASKLQG